MKTSLASAGLLALVQLAAAQKACESLTTLFPECARGCVDAAATQVGCTVQTDLACQCDPASSSAIQLGAVGCVLASCTKDGELGSALNAGPAICACVATAVPDTTTTSAADTTTTSAADTTTTSASEATTTTVATQTSAVTSHTTDTTSMVTSTASCGGSPCQKSADAVPSCAKGCISSAAETVAKCDFTDYECQCSSTATIQGAAQDCVISKCGIGNAVNVINSVSALCGCVTAHPTKACTGTASHTGTGTASGSGSGSQSGTKTQTGSGSGTKTGATTGKETCTAGPKKDCAPVASTAVPKCAQACFSSAAPSVGCGANDFACQCQPDAQSSLSQLLIPCVATACDSNQLPSVIAGASSVCACATAPPPAGACTTGGSGSGTQSQPPSRTNTETQPTKTGSQGGASSTCPDATTQDCGPVATSAVPSCAQKCFTSAAPKVGCAVDDYACQCESEAQASLSQLLIPCVATACDSNQLPGVIAGASSVCACASAAPTGGCSGGKPPYGGGSGGGSSGSQPTKTGGGSGGSGSGTTCAGATTANCGPVATSAVPSCAQKCFTSAAPKVGCAVDDYACQCEADAQASLSQLLVPCVATACDANQLPSVIAGASSVCACATAPPSGGNCGSNGNGGNGGNGGSPTGGQSGTPPKPTGGNSACSVGPITAADCGPVASTAVPDCAHACFSSAAPKVGCGADDYACQCQADAQASLSQLLVPCVATACDSNQLQAVITGASSVCACAQAAPTGGSGSNCGMSTSVKTGSSSGSSETEPAVVPGSAAARVEIGLIVGVVGAFWLLAVAL
ncbi:hypothetical protein BGZ63DRAFT_419909 [Mariannaea sp. PMI_226]|nr:hypothetical protein BGZ63DRAFT_419909 [Mariannaea sp. PMI_226]